MKGGTYMDSRRRGRQQVQDEIRKQNATSTTPVSVRLDGEKQPEPVMQVVCSYCPELLGREGMVLGVKPGEGVSNGICPECSAVMNERIGRGEMHKPEVKP